MASASVCTPHVHLWWDAYDVSRDMFASVVVLNATVVLTAAKCGVGVAVVGGGYVLLVVCIPVD